jgi:hypothetical protein
MSVAEPANSAAFYRWKDTQGLVHVVDSPDKVPEESRASAERVVLATSVKSSATDDHSTFFGNVRIEWESFGAGFAAAIVLGFVFVIARRTKKPLLELGVLVAVAAVIAVIYFGWVKQQSAQPHPSGGAQPVQIDDSNIAPNRTPRRPPR